MSNAGMPFPGAQAPGPQFGAPAPAPDAGKGKGKEKAPTKRAISSTRLIAIVLAVVAVLGVLVVVGKKPAPAAYVLRAKANLAALTDISADQLEVIGVPNSNLIESGAISGKSKSEVLDMAKDDVVGHKPRAVIPAGAQIRTDALILDFAADANLQLGPNDRLVSINAVPATAVAGNLRVGDHVDVIRANKESSSGTSQSSPANVIATDVEIIAINLPADSLNQIASEQTNAQNRQSSPSDLLPTNPVPGTYVVKVPADVALQLVAADANSTIYLTYRLPGTGVAAGTDGTSGVANGGPAATTSSTAPSSGR